MQPAETHTVGGNRGEEPEQKYEEVSSMKKKGYVEMRYYDVPQKEWVLALLGQEWVRAYGEGIRYLHFHNLFELGICRGGTGVLVLDRKNCPYHPGMISLIPKNYPHTTTSTRRPFLEASLVRTGFRLADVWLRSAPEPCSEKSERSKH